MSSKDKVKVSGMMTREQVLTYLKDVVKSLEDGQVVVTSGADFMTLVPPPILDFELELASKKDKERIRVEIAWKRTEQPIVRERPITITSGQGGKGGSGKSS